MRRPSTTPSRRPRRSAIRAWSRRRCAIGKRGKAGGIKIANDADEAREHSEAILGMDIRGFTVHDLWIESASAIAAEYYASIILDRSEKKLLAMLSRMGGMDVEEMAEKDPEALVKRHIEPGEEFGSEQAAQIAADAKIDDDVADGVAEMLVELKDVALAEDATLIEVNPLIVTEDREVVALDSKMTIDNNALFRHEDMAELRDSPAEDPQEQMAKEKGLTYVKLGGNVGILGNGAGLCMSTLDVVAQAGGEPANFLDAGGGSKAEAIVDALEVITSDPNVTAVLFNIFGGITRCDEVAKGIIEASRADRHQGAAGRAAGRDQLRGGPEAARARPRSTACTVEETMLGAAEKVVELASEQSIDAIIVGEDTKLVVSGLTGREGSFHGLRNRDYGTDAGRRRHPGKGGQDVDGVPIFDSIAEAVRARRQHLDDLRPRPLRRRRDRRGDRGRGGDGDRDHRGHPGATTCSRLLEGEGGGRAADRPELPRRALARARPTSGSSPRSSSSRARSASSPSRGR